MAIYTVSITDGTTLANLAVSAGRGPKGDGWTSVTYNPATGRFVFTSNDGLGYTSDDITVDLDAAVADAEAAQAGAEAAQTAAEAAQAATENIFDQFGDQYLGPKASDPTVDNDGDPLTEGDIYFNTTDDVLKFYSGAAWVAPEVIATTAASNAAASASAASTSASNASTSETNAAASAASAAASLDSFDDRYLGSKASAPTLDNDGNALLEGALYWNSVADVLYVWDGSAWQNASSFQIGGTASFDDGSASAPALRFVNDTDTGIYRSGDNSFSFTTGGTEAATFEDAGQTVFQLLSSGGDQLLNVDETTDDLLQVINADDTVLFQVSNTNGVMIGPAETPASATATGVTGQIAWDANYIYICTATNTWKRVAIATW
jgi:hypothetical protein